MIRRWIIVAVSFQVVAALTRLHQPPQCQILDRTQAHCADLPYNHTSFPNLAGDESSKLAVENMATFTPLITHNCHPDLKFFLCSVYFPMCNEKVPKPIGPCRPLCEETKKKCLPYLKQFGFDWPDSLNCTKFPPENNNEEMCMPGHSATKDPPVLFGVRGEDRDGWKTFNPAENYPITHTQCGTNTVLVNRSGRCVPTCNNVPGVSQPDSDSATRALIVLSLISVLLTFVCLLTFSMRRHCIDAVPETALLYCTLCFAGNSLVTLFSLLYRNQIACMNYGQHSLFIIPTIQHSPCSMAAALLYYFGTAGRLWWFVLCCSWKQTITDASMLKNYRVQVNIAAWLMPLGVVIMALMARSVSADGLSGLCLVGAASPAVFVLLRESLLLLCCVAPLIAGCCSLTGSPPQRDSHAATSGLVGALYPIAAIFFVVCQAQHVFAEPTTKGYATTSPASIEWNVASGGRLLTDPLLGVMAAAAYVIQITLNLFRNIRAAPDKAGYQAASLQPPGPPRAPNFHPPSLPVYQPTTIPATSTAYTSSARRC